MTVFCKYKITMKIVPDRGAIFDVSFPYFTQLEGPSAVLAEFYSRINGCARNEGVGLLRWVQGRDPPVIEKKVSGPERVDISEVCNDPRVVFAKKEDMIQTAAVPAEATHILVDMNNIYMWSGETPLEVRLERKQSYQRLRDGPVSRIR